MVMERVLSTHRSYEVGGTLGNGSFGVVHEAVCLETQEKVAIKKVLQDPRYKNRELDVMKQLNHPNIVSLRDYFYTEEDGNAHGSNAQRYLSVVMEYVPETVYKAIKQYHKMGTSMPMELVKVYSYQMLRSVGYLHSIGICHRDIKPQNLLVDTKNTHVVKLCDFGSAKRLHPGEQSVSYICSRFYRAPELMVGATEYTCAIDTWSVGCVLAEMVLQKPLFPGTTSVDQFVKIIQVLGRPTPEQVQEMNPHYTDFTFPVFDPRPLRTIIPQTSKIPDSIYDLLSQMLRYEPSKRIQPYAALAHSFFDELRKEEFRLPNGQQPPPLFNFSAHECKQMSADVRVKCLPDWIGS